MKFSTVSGSTYEIRDENGFQEVRRVNEGYGKRADGEWVPLWNNPPVHVGEPVILSLVGLSGYGPDDQGNEIPGATTTRITSLVKEIIHD